MKTLDNRPALKSFLNYLGVVSFPLIGLAAMLIISWVKRGYIEYKDDWEVPVITAPAVYFISIPLAFVVWLYAAERERPFMRRFSLPVCMLSLCGLIVATVFMTRGMPRYANALAAYGVVAGVFIFVSFNDCWDYAEANRKKTVIAFFAATMSALYKLCSGNLWYHMCHYTAVTVYRMLKTLGLAVNIDDVQFAMKISSKNFTIAVFQPCSGLEGTFIFLCLLSLLVIIDWSLFRKMPLTVLYLIGFVYMYCINVLRIATLFAIGYYSWQPDASPFMRSLRGSTFEMFHSMMGLVYCLIAFALFTICLYRVLVKRRLKKN
jgi:exosortase/archaeosortase family protein